MGTIGDSIRSVMEILISQGNKALSRGDALSNQGELTVIIGIVHGSL